MVTINATNRANRLLIVFSIVYSLLEVNIAFLAPITTIVIPYRYYYVLWIIKKRN